MQRVGDDVYTLLPDNGSDFLAGGTYYLAVVGRGTNGSYSNAGSGITPYTLTTELDLAETNMGTMGITGSSLTSTVNLNSSELGIYQFTIPDGPEMGGNPPEVIEVRLDNRIGSGWMTLRSGTRIPGPYTGGSSSYRYGVDQGNSAEKNDEQIITLVNPTPGIYTVTVSARATESTPVDTSADLVVENVGIAPLAFTGATSTPDIPSTSQDTLFDGQKNYYRVEVPEFIELPGELEGETFIQPIIGWKVTLTESSGDGSLRIMETLGEQGGFTTASSDDIAVVVPPLLRPGGVYYIEVRGSGAVDYQITSEVITFYSRWVMPGIYNVEFGDSNATDLAEDDWDYHAIDVPKNNGGLLRTELVALSGNPDLYIREDGVPTINHSVSGTGGAIYDRLLTGNDTEYANWVPLNGRDDIELSPGRWVIGVRAKDANARYRLKVSTGQVQSLNFAALEKADTPADLNEINDASVLSNDFIYYRVEIPEIPNTPASLSLTFAEDFGDVALHLRDSIPPGNGTRLPASPGSSIDYVIDADDDNKNRWSYWTSTNSGINNPGTTVFNFPELRPGTVYYVGVRGRLDANFDLNIAPSTSLVTDNFGTITNVPFKGIPGGISLTLAAGESRAYRIEIPDGATRFVSNHTHSSEIEVRIEQGTLPLPGSSGSQVHRLLSGANTVFNQPITTTWPWVAGEDYYLLFTNTGAVSETMSFNLAGEGEATRLSGWAASYGLSGMAADTDAVNNPRGVTNLSAYAFNIHPVTGQSLGGGWPLPKFVLSGKVNPFPGLEMLIPTTAPSDICYIVEENSQLEGMWIERGVRAGNGSWLGSGFFVEEGVNSNQTRHTVYSARSLKTAPRNFLRIKVQLIAP